MCRKTLVWTSCIRSTKFHSFKSVPKLSYEIIEEKLCHWCPLPFQESLSICFRFGFYSSFNGKIMEIWIFLFSWVVSSEKELVSNYFLFFLSYALKKATKITCIKTFFQLLGEHRTWIKLSTWSLTCCSSTQLVSTPGALEFFPWGSSILYYIQQWETAIKCMQYEQPFRFYTYLYLKRKYQVWEWGGVVAKLRLYM